MPNNENLIETDKIKNNEISQNQKLKEMCVTLLVKLGILQIKVDLN